MNRKLVMCSFILTLSAFLFFSLSIISGSSTGSYGPGLFLLIHGVFAIPCVGIPALGVLSYIKRLCCHGTR